jgi:serine/threonine protein kinase
MNLHIEIPHQSDNISPNYNKYKRLLFKLKSISEESSTIKLNNNDIEELRGDHIGRGGFGTVSVFSPCNKYILKESTMLKKANNIAKQFCNETIDQLSDLIDDSINEPINIQYFSSLYNIFPNNTIQLHDHFKSKNDKIYQNNFIMDKVEGMTLDTYFNQPNIDPMDVISMFLQSIYIILYANTTGIFHNDLKSNNIMVNINNNINIMDVLILHNNIITLETSNINAIFIDYSISRKTTNSITPLEYHQVSHIYKSLVTNNKYMSDNMTELLLIIISCLDNFQEEISNNMEYLNSLTEVRVISPTNYEKISVLTPKTSNKIIDGLRHIQQILYDNEINNIKLELE